MTPSCCSVHSSNFSSVSSVSRLISGDPVTPLRLSAAPHCRFLRGRGARAAAAVEGALVLVFRQ